MSQDVQRPESEDRPEPDAKENFVRALLYPLLLFVGVPVLLSLVIRYLM